MLAAGKLYNCVNIERLGPGDDGRVAGMGSLFDRPARADAATRFLNDPGHHLLVAYDGDLPIGFVTGVEMTHPDKGTEMFLYELGVADGSRRRGVGRALVSGLVDIARGRNCHGVWVLTEMDNAAALAVYESAGARREGLQVMLSWDLRDA